MNTVERSICLSGLRNCLFARLRFTNKLRDQLDQETLDIEELIRKIKGLEEVVKGGQEKD